MASSSKVSVRSAALQVGEASASPGLSRRGQNPLFCRSSGCPGIVVHFGEFIEYKARLYLLHLVERWLNRTPCTQVARLVDEEDYDLFLLDDQASPPPHLVTPSKRKAISVLVPDPAHVERLIEKVKAMDERAALKHKQLLGRYWHMDAELSMMRKHYKVGNVQAGDAIKERLNVEYGFSNADWD